VSCRGFARHIAGHFGDGHRGNQLHSYGQEKINSKKSNKPTQKT